MGKCGKHNVALVPQDVGKGKWIPIYLWCEKERKDKLAEIFPVMTKF